MKQRGRSEFSVWVILGKHGLVMIFGGMEIVISFFLEKSLLQPRFNAFSGLDRWAGGGKGEDQSENGRKRTQKRLHVNGFDPRTGTSFSVLFVIFAFLCGQIIFSALWMHCCIVSHIISHFAAQYRRLPNS